MARSKNQESKRSPKPKPEKKALGLFDHVKHIRTVQNPDYYTNLTELDRKSFNHFMILQALSMDPQLLSVISTVYRYFDVIPSPQFYQLLIAFIPKNSTFYPWIGSKNKYKKELLDLMVRRFEVSTQQAEEYVDLLSTTDEGVNSLVYICQGFGKTDNEIQDLLSAHDDN
jgi:hypothetical protein